MPVVPMREILDPAFAERYGVAAINVVDDLSLEAVLAAATDLEAPLIVQTSLKTVKSIGARPFMHDVARAGRRRCPSRSRCTSTTAPTASGSRPACATGWNSVLFDGSELDVDENTRQTIEVVAEADGYGAQVEGEIESVVGVEDGIGSEEARRGPSRRGLQRVHRRDGVYSFAPAIGTAHGLYKARAEAHARAGDRDRRAVTRSRMVLHGGTGPDARRSSPTSSRAGARRSTSRRR